jgi:DNA-binding IclR family transcriptional regulator
VITPSVERAVRILDLMTTHPGRGFTVAELSRRLGIKRSTAHVLVTTLHQLGLLSRSAESREYRLGPALVPMGSVAERAFPALVHARREAERLAAEYDAECVIVTPVGDELLVVGHAGTPGPLSITYVEGQRAPLAPPLGEMSLAWTSDEAFEAWLRRLDHAPTDAERSVYRAAIASARERGYAAGVRVPRLHELQELYASADLHTPAGRRELSRALSALAQEDFLPLAADLPRDVELSFIAAPVFGPDGTMLLTLTFLPGEHYGAEDMPRLARAVVRAADRVTAAIDGRKPALEGARAWD